MPALPSDARAGLVGKLPGRGAFVRENLPRDFTDVWDAWWQRGLGETQRLPRDEWIAAWLEAPVWRFRLPPRWCGRHDGLGIWRPSVDKAGRYSPLTIAATAPGDWAPSVGAMTSFLAAAEQSGRDALEHDLDPGDLLQRIQDAFIASDAPAPAPDLVPGRAAWWRQGGTRFAARLETATALPEGSRFAALIDDEWGTTDPPAELAIARTDPS